jgi:hypothetical protein
MLDDWYKMALSKKYHDRLGTDLLQSVLAELSLEFPLTDPERVRAIFEGRKYDFTRLRGEWAVQSV